MLGYNPRMTDQPTQPPTQESLPSENGAKAQTPPAPGAQQKAPTSPTLVDLITVVLDKVDPLIRLVQTTMEQRQKSNEHEARFQTRMAGYAILVVIAVVGAAGFLTYEGKIDGSTFTFLLGLIVGYVLTFVRDQITGPEG